VAEEWLTGGGAGAGAGAADEPAAWGIEIPISEFTAATRVTPPAVTALPKPKTPLGANEISISICPNIDVSIIEVDS
jgi:hypothetical protein